MKGVCHIDDQELTFGLPQADSGRQGKWGLGQKSGNRVAACGGAVGLAAGDRHRARSQFPALSWKRRALAPPASLDFGNGAQRSVIREPGFLPLFPSLQRSGIFVLCGPAV